MAQEARGGVRSARGKSGSACALLRAACRSTPWQPGDVFQGSGLGPVALPVGRLYLAIPTARSLNPSNRRQALPRRREASSVLLRARWLAAPALGCGGVRCDATPAAPPPPQNTSKQNKTVHAQSQPGRDRSPPRRSARERRGRRAPGWRAHLPGGRRRRRRRRHRPGPRRGARHRRCFCFCPRGATCSARGPSQRRSSRRSARACHLFVDVRLAYFIFS